ncbi:hypothetical protein [Maribellus comscasis]|uniref:hypothetical protein n=1 Tax=Maribellus comscasis TaxID=2681766 RepID=UPI001C2CCD67|nr:hypothetical protein [Maribellus comscasis]
MTGRGNSTPAGVGCFAGWLSFYTHTIPLALSDQRKNAGFVLSCTFAGMADVHGKATRSCNMSGIRGKTQNQKCGVPDAGGITCL